MNIKEFRDKYPQYNSLSDEVLTEKLHAKHYSDMSIEEFRGKFLVQDDDPVVETQKDQPQMTTDDMFNMYRNGQMSPDQIAAFEELVKRRIQPQNVMSVSHGSPFKSKEPLKPKGDTVTPQEFVEPALTMATGMVAEPIAGVAGMVRGAFPGEEGSAAEAVGATREALTYKPRTERGAETLEEIGELVKPVAEFVGGLEQSLGDTAYEKTGSPAIAAAAATIPTALTEVLGIASGRGALRATRSAQKRMSGGVIYRDINEAVPDIDTLFKTSSDIFDEIDELGASIKQANYGTLVTDIRKTLERQGLDKTITPKANQALIRMEELLEGDVPLTQLDTMRKVAQNAAKAIEPTEQALGVAIIDKIDDFVENLDTRNLVSPIGVDAQDISKRYKVARDLWGRGRRSEMLQEVFEKARNQATGFENGLRVQFRQILNNKKKRKFFNKKEIDAMTKVVRGDTKENLAKLIGKFGFSEGQAVRTLVPSIGIGAGAYVGGAPGAVIFPLIGQVSRKLAQRMTARNAEFADMVIRAGKDAEKIAKAYRANTPRSLRRPEELADLLMSGDIDINALPDDVLTQTAKQIVNNRRAELAGVMTAGAVPREEQ